MFALRPMALIVFVTFLAGWAASLLHHDPEHAKPDRGERPTAGVTIGPGEVPDVPSAQAAVVAAFYAEQQRLEEERVTAYLDALEQTRLAAVAEAARVAAARQATAAPAPRAGTGAPHSDAWWHGVAMCEQGGRNDPYFGYFSWMDGSAAGMTWDQQVAKSNALLERVSSESPAWAPACVAAGYAASPGG